MDGVTYLSMFVTVQVLGTCIHDTDKCVLQLVKSRINIHEMLVCVGNIIMFQLR